MDAFSEFVLDHVQLARLATCTWGRKTLVSVTAQAGIVGGIADLGFRGLRAAGRVRGMGLLLPHN